MPGVKVPPDPSIDMKDTDDKDIRTMNIDQLETRSCYFSLSGDLALKAFSNIKFSTFKKENRRNKLKEALKQRLYFAVLMFDNVIMHCSDPLRSDIVLEILEENIYWVKNGNILFVFSNQVNNIIDDYKKYIDNKINDYSEGYCSEKEAESLKQPHINEKYYERVINVLKLTKLMLRKSNDSNCFFDKLVINDLNSQFQSENVIVDTYTDLSQSLSLNLSLFQLLHIRHLKCKGDEEKEYGYFVFPPPLVNDVVDGILDCLEQGNTIARSAIVDSLEEEIKKDGRQLTRLQKNVLNAITLRMDVLYCKMNSGKQLILEFHPSYENRSNYQIDCFDEYLKLISGSHKKINLTSSKIDRILKHEQLLNFRFGYLNCMVDTREHIKLAQLNSNNSNQYQEKLLELFQTVALRNGIGNADFSSAFANIIMEVI